jgi:hypothetical protein
VPSPPAAPTSRGSAGTPRKDLDPRTGSEIGPYEPWQVVGLALTLAAVAAIGGWLGRVTATVGGTTVAVTVMFAVDAATQVSKDASLWPIGAGSLALGAGLGLSVVALAAYGLKRLVDRS